MDLKTRHDKPKHLPEGACPNCWKVGALCLCSELKPVESRRHILLLQHPAEIRSPLGTARLVSLLLPDAHHRVGLSWRGLPAALKVDPKQVEHQQWAVLYLGPKKAKAKKKPKPLKKGAKPVALPVEPIVVVKPKPVPKDTRPFRLEKSDGSGVSVGTIRGLIVLDGNWKQAKALWWRNPWLNRLPRLSLNPSFLSQYGSLRRQARRQGLSTIEAVSAGLEALGEGKKVTDLLQSTMETFMARASSAPVERAGRPFVPPRAPGAGPESASL